jgi:hypothetical protein
MSRATGTFDVKVIPQASDMAEEGVPLARLSIDKQFHGDLDGVSRGEMLSAGSPATGSAGYVAIERVQGTLEGRKGTFALQHNGTMIRGMGQLAITVVPDSGTGELQGLDGRMEIVIEQGKHSYIFDYELESAHDRG